MACGVLRASGLLWGFVRTSAPRLAGILLAGSMCISVARAGEEPAGEAAGEQSPSGSGAAWYNLYPAESGGRVTVAVESEEGGIQGWTLALCHQASGASIETFGLTPELDTIRRGNPPDFVVCEEARDLETGRVGLVQAVVLSYRELIVLPLREGGFPVLDVEYSILGTSPSTVEVCSGLIGSGQPVLSVLTRRGQSIVPTKIARSTLSRVSRNAWFNSSPPITDSTVTISVESTNADIQGWSLGVCHDPAAASIVGFGATADLRELLDANPQCFYYCEEGDGETSTGVVQAVALLPTEGTLVLPARTSGFPVLHVTYSASSETSVQVCSGLEGSGEPVQAVLTSEGQTLRPSQPAGSTLVPRTPASQLAYRAEPPESGEVITVKLYATDVQVQGWSFALCNTQEAAMIVGLETSPEVSTLVDGEEPSYIVNELVPAGRYMAVTQKVILGSVEAPIELGPFGGGLPLLGIRYEVLQDDSLKFCDQDSTGSIAFDNGVQVDGRTFVPWTRMGARLVRGALGTTFIRGDVDLNGSLQMTDAIRTLMSLFLGGGPLPCLDAADANDIGRVDISDPIFTLRYLFLGGPPPPAPFPEPGQDVSPSTALGCDRGL